MDVASAECWRAVAVAGGERMVAEEGKTRATDFSIAAIMARSAGAAEPRSPVARSPPLTGNLGLLQLYCSFLAILLLNIFGLTTFITVYNYVNNRPRKTRTLY